VLPILPIINTYDNSICKYCNKKLCDRKYRWKHEKICKENKDAFTCKLCNDKFNNRQTKWRHEKNCKENKPNSTEDDLKVKVDELVTKKMDKLLKTMTIQPKINYPINNHLIDIIIDKSKAIEVLKTEIENKENTLLEIDSESDKDLLNKELIEAHKKEINFKDHKIQLLEDSFIKKQRRKEYPDKNIIYMLTTDDNKKKRTYIIGKTINLKNRLSNYNKTAEHEVIYFKSCNNEDDMDVIEIMVLNKLKKYKEKANRDRFILPLEKDITFFINIIDSCINFVCESTEKDNNIEV
jgi:hypothetical protein